MSLKEGIRKARGIDLTEDELHSTIKSLNTVSNKIIHGDSMKTFQDIINESKPDDIVKKYTINGNQIKLQAKHFMKYPMRGAVITDTISCNIEQMTENIVSIKFTGHCIVCEGTGEYECEECDGEGDSECFECHTTLTCDACYGNGLLECDCGIIDENEIIFEDEININQLELFV